MLAAWGHQVFRWRRATLAASAVLLAASLAVLLSGARLTAAHIPNTEADRGLHLIERELHQPGGSSFVVLFSSRTLAATDPAFQRAVEAALAAVRTDPRIERVRTPYNVPEPIADTMRSRDGHQAVAQIALRESIVRPNLEYPALRAAIHSDTLTLTFTGSLAFRHDLDQVLAHDLRKGELLSLPLAVLVLLVVFGSLTAATLPVGVGGLAVLGGMATIFLLSRAMDVTQYSLNIVSLVGLGVAIDYSLFIVNRFRDELDGGASTEQAIVRTLATAGRAVAFSGVAVAIGLSGLLFYRGTYLSSMGLAGSIVVALAVLYALTFLPALLAVLGPRVNAGRVGRARTTREIGHGTWHRIATWVMRRPVLVLVPTLAFTLFAGAPFLRLNLAAADITVLPLTQEARRGHEMLRAQFPALSATRVVTLVRFPTAPALTPERVGALYDLSRRIAAVPGVARVEGVANFDPTMSREDYQRFWDLPPFLRPAMVNAAVSEVVGDRVVLISALTRSGPASREARNIVRSIRANRRVADGELLVTGQSAVDLDTTDFIRSHTPAALGFVMSMTCLVLFLLLGSVLLPIKAVVMNLLSISASFGALVWIFQEGHLHGLLGFEPAPIEPALPVVLFCAVFGLSMDYEVLMLTRMQEEYARTGDNTRAVAEGLERSGRLITSAAAIMVAVFLAFALAQVVVLKAVGLGMAIAVALDASIVRVLIVPASMRLFGALNWWAPAPLARLQKRLGFGGEH